MSNRKYLSVADTLRDMLIDKRWAYGERLPAERALADELGVPRATVREAIIVLEVEGLLEVRHASGIYVCDAAPSPRVVLPDDLSPFELLRARQVLESSIAAAAALSVTDDQIQQMRAALEQEERDIAERRGSYEGDARFHHILAEATQNQALVAAMEQLWSLRQNSQLWSRLHTRIFDDGYRRAWSADHYEILAAIEARDPDSARAAMWRHLGNVSRTLMILTDLEDVISPPYKRGVTARIQ
ncbi:FCD domain-containing protein [Pararhodobacter sp.]|uniref:FCD domain-containing protein n=1 Tax=Pararhodobacter sp. TaxID=2127056 RepID=UPI002AFFB4BC|nr:FCD domain-containing protein [Pararhodobacter sp.]